MKRIILLLLLVIFSASIPQLWAKEGKIKYGKYVEYQGNVEKINGKKCPIGNGILVVQKKNNQKKMEEYLYLKGLFNDTIVSDCNLKIVGKEERAEVVFQGKISFRYDESDKKTDVIVFSFIEGNYQATGVKPYHTEKPVYIDNGDWKAIVTISKDKEEIKYEGCSVLTAIPTVEFHYKVVDPQIMDWTKVPLSFTMELSENGIRMAEYEQKAGNNIYYGSHYTSGKDIELGCDSAYLKKDSCNFIKLGRTPKDLHVYSFKRNDCIIKDTHFENKIAKGTLIYPDKKYEGTFKFNVYCSETYNPFLVDSSSELLLYNGMMTYPDGRKVAIQDGKPVFNVDKDIIGVWKQEFVNDDAICYYIFNKDGTLRYDFTHHYVDGTIDYYAVATLKVTLYAHWKSINTLYQACLVSPTKNNSGESTVVMKQDSFYVSPLMITYHDVPEAQKKEIIRKFQQAVDGINELLLSTKEEKATIEKYNGKDTIDIKYSKYDWVKVDSILMETGMSRAEKKWIEGAGARQYQAKRHKKLIESYGPKYAKAIEDGRYVVGMTREMVKEISTNWLCEFLPGGIECWVPEYALHIHFQSTIPVEQLIFVNGTLSSIGRVTSNYVFNNINNYVRF